ncbi:hypothetical protein BEV13_05515, partial [Rickettsiella grylli]|uniref:phosphatase PAP2 family protein n=1 Tax=Rickettsiella grylli TaxID=59196 RepID=UPI0008FCF341
WLVYAFLKACYAGLSRLLDKQVAQLWRFTRHHPRLKTIASLLTDTRHPHSHEQLALALTCVFSALGFLVVALSVFHHGFATDLNEPIYHFMRSLRQDNVDAFFVAMAELSPKVLTVFWIVLLAFFLIKRNFWLSVHWGLAGLLSYGLGDLFKQMLHITRPDGLIQIPAGPSFPSGHTVSSIALLGFFAVIIGIEKPKPQRVLIYGLTSAIIFLVLFSRIYLTAHWFSDVVGGALLGISILAGLTFSYRRKIQFTTISSGKIAVIGILTLLFVWGAHLNDGYKKLLSNSQLRFPNQTIDLKEWWNHAGSQTPLYRLGYFGQKIEALNIQWVGKLSDIQHHLEKKGWHRLPKTNLVTTLYRLSLHTQDPNTPLFVSSNAGRAPVLTMTKYIRATPHHLIVLNLWDSHQRLSNGVPLWFGLVHYHQTWRLQFQPIKKQPTLQNLVPASTLLQQDLKSYAVKNVSYTPLQANVLFIQ